MKITKSFKYRLYPNMAQREILAKHFGCVRFVYNYFLRKRIDYYDINKDNDKKGLNYYDTAGMLTQLKKDTELKWLKEVNSQSLQQSLRDLDTAYNNFLNKRSKFPKFKKKKNKQSFRVPQNWWIVDGKLSIPKCKGIRIKQHRQLEGDAKYVTVSVTLSGKYYAAVCCEVEIQVPEYTGSEVGIDYGAKNFVTTSEGEVVNSPGFLRQSEQKLKRLQRRLSRKQKGSNNQHKARVKVARQHEKIYNQRQDFLHKLSMQMISDNQAVYIESLAISNMVKNRKLAKSISDSGWNSFVNMLKYKGQWYGCRINEVDRFYPSTKQCNRCGHINNDLTLADRAWQCPECGIHHDRDINAAINILEKGRAGTVRT